MMMGWCLAIVVAAVLVFLASSFIHMVLPWHKHDFPKLANEDALLDALRPVLPPPGDYMVPRPAQMGDLNSPAFQEKLRRGPVMVFTVFPNGPSSMGRNLLLWFLYLLAVCFFTALAAGTSGLASATYVHARFHLVAVTSFLGYTVALWQMSIWWRRSWAITVRSTVDGFIYALITAGVFVWLWPH